MSRLSFLVDGRADGYEVTRLPFDIAIISAFIRLGDSEKDSFNKGETLPSSSRTLRHKAEQLLKRLLIDQRVYGFIGPGRDCILAGFINIKRLKEIDVKYKHFFK